jgi:hypothetical protein
MNDKLVTAVLSFGSHICNQALILAIRVRCDLAGKCAFNKSLSKLAMVKKNFGISNKISRKTVGGLKSYFWLQHLTNGLDKKCIIYKLTRYVRKVVPDLP